jgi:hypothetical protein
MNLHRTLAYLGFCVIAATGCDNRPAVGTCVPVQGKVTLGANPLNGGMVSFIPLDGPPNAVRPEGDIDEQGNYSLKTAGKDGAPPGKYRAIVTTSGNDKRQDNSFDSTYSHTDNSPLEYDVIENAPAGAYDIKLKARRRR